MNKDTMPQGLLFDLLLIFKAEIELSNQSPKQALETVKLVMSSMNTCEDDFEYKFDKFVKPVLIGTKLYKKYQQMDEL